MNANSWKDENKVRNDLLNENERRIDKMWAMWRKKRLKPIRGEKAKSGKEGKKVIMNLLNKEGRE